MEPCTTWGLILNVRDGVQLRFETLLDDRIETIGRAQGVEMNASLLYNGIIMSPKMTLRFYNFKSGDIIVAASHYDVPNVCSYMRNRTPRRLAI